MGSALQYRIPINTSENEGYSITNGTARDFREDNVLGVFNRPGIKITSCKGLDFNECIFDSEDKDDLKNIFKNLLNGKVSTSNPLTAITLSDNHVTLYFLPEDYYEKMDLDSIWVFTNKDFEMYLEVSSDDELPFTRFKLGSSYRDSNQMVVTEFHEHMTKDVMVVNEPNPYYDSKVHHKSESKRDVLRITQYWD